MKKNLISIVLAAAVLTVISCRKNVTTEPQENTTEAVQEEVETSNEVLIEEVETFEESNDVTEQEEIQDAFEENDATEEIEIEE